MARSILDLISQGGPVISFIREALSLGGLTPTGILRELRASGLSIATQTFYQVVSYLKRQPGGGGSYLNQLGGDELPDPRQLNLTQSDRDTNYTILIQVTGTDPDTGELDTQYVTVISNRLLSKNQAIGVAGQMFAQNEERYSVSFGAAVVVDYRQNRAGLR